MTEPVKVIVIGGGAAGLMAAGTAAMEGADVTVFEKNDRPGRKLLITGKGRCNITNEADIDTFIKNFPETGRFLYSALYTFSNWQVIDFFRKYGVLTQIERGGRIFPESGAAKDVVDALVKYTKESGAKYYFKQAVKGIVVEAGQVIGVRTKEGSFHAANKVILATGGLSYPGTGSSGDGYEMARKLGHTIQSLLPSLVPLVTKETWINQLQGLSLRNVKLTFYQQDKMIGEDFGEMLFTDYGLTGPIVLSLSRTVVPLLAEGEVVGSLDLKPALSEEKLDERIQRDFAKYSRKDFKNSLNDLLPRLLIPVIIQLVEISEEKKIHQITAEERGRLVHLLKNLTFTVVDHRGFREAIVTRGGVDTREINPGTMESKLVKGLYFAGEVIDLDAYTGGFNLQAAFSTGYLAGISVVEG